MKSISAAAACPPLQRVDGQHPLEVVQPPVHVVEAGNGLVQGRSGQVGQQVEEAAEEPSRLVRLAGAARSLAQLAVLDEAEAAPVLAGVVQR